MQGFGNGADEWIRTTDLLITNQLLCQLSYIGFSRLQYTQVPPHSLEFPTERIGILLPSRTRNLARKSAQLFAPQLASGNRDHIRAAHRMAFGRCPSPGAG